MRTSSNNAELRVIRPGVLLVRHGQTTWNAAQRWQGWADVELSSRGKRQAKLGAQTLKRVLREIPVQVVTSDLVRAHDTASEIAAALGVPVARVVEDLRERNVGEWSGKTTDEINKMWPGQLEAWRNGELVSTPNGEREDVLVERTLRALRELTTEARDLNHVVDAATHGGVIRTLTRLCGGAPRPVGNLDGSWFGIDDNGEVVHHHDVHLLAGNESGNAAGTAL